jgi:hypothetical protein
VTPASELSSLLLPTFHTPDNLPLLTDSQGGETDQDANFMGLNRDHANQSCKDVVPRAEAHSDVQSLPNIAIEQNDTGTRAQPVIISDNSLPIKQERSDSSGAQVSKHSRAVSLTTSTAINKDQPQSNFSRPGKKDTLATDGIYFRFRSDSAHEPRERPFSQCNNVKLLFSNAKQGGLLKGEFSMAPILALQVPGIHEPIGILINDNKDFEKFVKVLEDAVGSTNEFHEKFVVEVRPDHFD